MQRATWVEIDLDAIAANVTALKARSVATSLMAVVKADAYGHGLVPAARAAVAGGADWLGVALVEEGRALRAAGIEAPILVLSEPPVAAAADVVDSGLTPTVYSPVFVAALDAAASAAGGPPLAVHLKLDTGMRRLGVPEADWEDALRRVRDARHLEIEGLWSHLAVADQPGHPFTTQQAEVFARGVALAKSLGVEARLVHLCNSAGTLQLPEHHYDMVRPGLAVYGLEPAPGLAEGLGLRPALAWYARLTLVKALAAGEPVGYGLAWTSPVDTIVGTIDVGYADGLRRAASVGGHVVWRGRPAPLAGTVSMDHVVVDLGPDGPASVGDDVALIGADDGVGVTAEDWASWLGTINYEVLCGISARVPRVYLGGV